VIKLAVVIKEGYHCYQLHTKFYQICLSTPYVEEIVGDHLCEFRCKRTNNDQMSNTVEEMAV